MARPRGSGYNFRMDSGLSAAVGGVQQAFAAHSERAQRIARDGIDGEHFVRDMAELPGDDDSVKANMSVIKTQDEMLGALLDLFA
jgi:hypothetical protein